MSTCEFCEERPASHVYCGLHRCHVCKLRQEIREAEAVAASLPNLRDALVDAERRKEAR